MKSFNILQCGVRSRVFVYRGIKERMIVAAIAKRIKPRHSKAKGIPANPL